jgi:hypothetical protein
MLLLSGSNCSLGHLLSVCFCSAKASRYGTGLVNQLNHARMNRKTVVKYRQSTQKVRTPLRYFTEDGYLQFYGRTVDQDDKRKLMVVRKLKGKSQLVYIEKLLPEGVLEGFDEEEQGARMEEEVESGEDDLRPEQADAKFNAMFADLAELSHEAEYTGEAIP